MRQFGGGGAFWSVRGSENMFFDGSTGLVGVFDGL